MTPYEAVVLVVVLAVTAWPTVYALFFWRTPSLRVLEAERLKREAKERRRAAGDALPVAEGEDITAHELGEIEASLENLVRVVVAAHRVEAPENALRAAVERNFARRVKYEFLVSSSTKDSEKDGWINVFIAIAKVILAKEKSPYKPKDVVNISRLSHDWRDSPYVFYFMVDSSNRSSVVAFRGNQRDEGIAEMYQRLPGRLAYSLATALLSDAPTPMHIEEEPFFNEPTTTERQEANDA